MKTDQITFRSLMEGTKQYIVPLYQRVYSWGRKDWETLWDDLVSLCTNPHPNTNTTHFIGTMVTLLQSNSAKNGIEEHIIIDGQQRLITLMILLASLRDHAEQVLGDELHETILINKFKSGDSLFKVLPSQPNRPVFEKIVLKQKIREKDKESLLWQCYHFFEKKFVETPKQMQDEERQFSISALATTIREQLVLVQLQLDEKDENPHSIFASLNATGQTLTQADLIRNYIFMKLSPEQQKEAYKKYWEPMEAALKDNLTECIRQYLMLDGQPVKEKKVYIIFKDHFQSLLSKNDTKEETNAWSCLQDISKFAKYYDHLIHPKQGESNPILVAKLLRIQRYFDISVAYPFLLHCYDDYAQDRLSSNDFVRLLDIIVNFFVRRFVCDIPTNKLQRIFASLYQKATENSTGNFLQDVCLVLQKERYPQNEEFCKCLKTSPIYVPGEDQRKLIYILQTLEESYQHHEPVDLDSIDWTIEHIMPQTLNHWWNRHLAPNHQDIHQRYLHTLGNLTLTTANPALYNSSFPEKQRILAESHLEMNRYFRTLSCWDESEIQKRSQKLADLAMQIWPDFAEQIAYIGSLKNVSYQDDLWGEDHNVKGTQPNRLVILEKECSVTSWRSVLVETLNVIADSYPHAFDIVLKSHKNLTKSKSQKYYAPRHLNNGVKIETNFDAQTIYILCQEAIAAAGLSPNAWQCEWS